MYLPISWGVNVAARRYGLFEPLTTKTIQSIVKPGMIVIELGAAYGDFTLQFSKLVGPKGRVIAFEPLPRYFSILKKNIEINKVNNVTLLNKAVSDNTVSKCFFDADAKHPYASLKQISGFNYALTRAVCLTKNKKKQHAKIEIECVPLSEFIQENDIQMDVLFMDIEGCEIKVFKDMQKLLLSEHRKRPIIFFESHEQFYHPEDLEWIKNLMNECNYSIQNITEYHILCRPQGKRCQ